MRKLNLALAKKVHRLAHLFMLPVLLLKKSGYNLVNFLLSSLHSTEQVAGRTEIFQRFGEKKHLCILVHEKTHRVNDMPRLINH